MPAGPKGLDSVSPSCVTRPPPKPSSPNQTDVSVVCWIVSRPVHGWWNTGRAAADWTNVAQPGSWTAVAVAGTVVIVPKKGVVPVAMSNVAAESVPVATWNTPWPPPTSVQGVCSTDPMAWKCMSIALGAMLVPVRTVALVSAALAVKRSPPMGA